MLDCTDERPDWAPRSRQRLRPDQDAVLDCKGYSAHLGAATATNCLDNPTRVLCLTRLHRCSAQLGATTAATGHPDQDLCMTAQMPKPAGHRDRGKLDAPTRQLCLTAKNTQPNWTPRPRQPGDTYQGAVLDCTDAQPD